jgi:hypothetical protein
LSTGTALRGGGLLGFSKSAETATPFRERFLRAIFGLLSSESHAFSLQMLKNEGLQEATLLNVL